MRCTKHLLLGDFRVDESGWPTAHYQMYHEILRKMRDESTNRGQTAYVLGAGSVRGPDRKLHFNSAFNNKVCARDLWDMRLNATTGSRLPAMKELDERTRAAAIKAGDKACDQELADWVKTNWSKTRDWSTLTEKQLIKGMPKRSMFQAARAAVL